MIEKETITFDEFRAWLTGLIVGKRGALPDLDDWKQIKQMMDKVVPEKETITIHVPTTPVQPEPHYPWTPPQPYYVGDPPPYSIPTIWCNAGMQAGDYDTVSVGNEMGSQVVIRNGDIPYEGPVSVAYTAQVDDDGIVQFDPADLEAAFSMMFTAQGSTESL